MIEQYTKKANPNQLFYYDEGVKIGGKFSFLITSLTAKKLNANSPKPNTFNNAPPARSSPLQDQSTQRDVCIGQEY